VAQLMEDLSAIRYDGHTAPADMIDIWISHTGDPDTQRDTVVEQAKRLHMCAKRLTTTEFDLTYPIDFDVTGRYAMAGAEDTKVSIADVNDAVASEIAPCPYLQSIMDFLSSAGAVVFEKLYKEVELSALQFQYCRAQQIDLPADEDLEGELFGDDSDDGLFEPEHQDSALAVICTDVVPAAAEAAAVVVPASTVEGPSLSAIVANILDVNLLCSGAVEATRGFSKKCLECQSAAVQLLNLLKTVYPDSDDKVACAGPLLSQPVSVEAKHLWALARIWIPLQTVTTTLGFIVAAFEKDTAIVEGALTPEIENALMRLGNWPELQWTEAAGAEKSIGGRLTVPLGNLKGWWHAFQASRTAIYRAALRFVLEKSHDIAMKLPPLPPYVHYLCSAVYNRSLVKRHLLPIPVRKTMAASLKVLGAMHLYGTQLHRQFGLGDSDFVLHSSVSKGIENLYLETQKVAAITAACSIVQESDPAKQPAEASRMLAARSTQLPASLVAALQPLAALHVAPAAAMNAPAPKRRRGNKKTD
jgi:hypothetical protein